MKLNLVHGKIGIYEYIHNITSINTGVYTRYIDYTLGTLALYILIT